MTIVFFCDLAQLGCGHGFYVNILFVTETYSVGTVYFTALGTETTSTNIYPLCVSMPWQRHLYFFFQLIKLFLTVSSGVPNHAGESETAFRIFAKLHIRIFTDKFVGVW